MKKLTIFLFILFSTFGTAQELMNFYLEPYTFSSDTDITLHTTFYHYSGAGLCEYNYTIEDGIIDFNLIYGLSSTGVVTFDQKRFEINLPSDGTYTINVNFYTDGNGYPCDYDNLVETRTKTFDFPYYPTEKISIPDNIFELYLEGIGFGDGVEENDLVFLHRIENLVGIYFNAFFGVYGETVYDLTGLKYITQLRKLNCIGHMISQFDFSYNTELESLRCSNNPITELDVSTSLNLKNLWCEDLNITSLDVSNNILLEELFFSGNGINEIDLTNNPDLKNIICSNTSMTDLNLEFNELLEVIYILGNEELSSITITSLPNLFAIYCYGNSITEFDLSSSPNLREANFSDNHLHKLNIKNGNNEDIISVDTLNNPNLICIEVDVVTDPMPFDYQIDPQTIFSTDCPD